MEQLALDLRFKELTIGDKVVIIGKSVGGSLPFEGWRIGDVGFIKEKDTDNSGIFKGNTYFLTKTLGGGYRSGRFHQKDLRRV